MSQARILIVTQPQSLVRHRLCARINALGLDKELGERLFSQITGTKPGVARLTPGKRHCSPCWPQAMPCKRHS